MQQNPEQLLALRILTTYVKGTPNRAHGVKAWEKKIAQMCLDTLGATTLFKDRKCECGGFFILKDKKAICPACGLENKDFRTVPVPCRSCGLQYDEVAWSDEEEKKVLRSDYNYCRKC